MSLSSVYEVPLSHVETSNLRCPQVDVSSDDGTQAKLEFDEMCAGWSPEATKDSRAQARYRHALRTGTANAVVGAPAG
jgi:hypothetical protein